MCERTFAPEEYQKKIVSEIRKFYHKTTFVCLCNKITLGESFNKISSVEKISKVKQTLEEHTSVSSSTAKGKAR